MVLYYHLPENHVDSIPVTLEIRNEAGEMIRRFSSKKDASFISYDGGPTPEPVISSKKGVNRFVWDLRHATMPGIPTAFIEGSYRGHKAIPGSYQIKVKAGNDSSQVLAKIIPNPHFALTQEAYVEYDRFMSEMEKELTAMHRMVNTAMAYQNQLKALMDQIKTDADRKDLYLAAQTLQKSMQAWDESMVQRKSKAYDDVENFPNKFTANYLYLINQSDSEIPRITQGSRDRLAELNAEWVTLKAEGNALLQEEIPKFNALAQERGIGALYVKKD
jgi:hypothetical protein